MSMIPIEQFQERQEIIKKMVVALRCQGYCDTIIVAHFFPVHITKKLHFTEDEATAYLQGYLPGLDKEE